MFQMALPDEALICHAKFSVRLLRPSSPSMYAIGSLTWKNKIGIQSSLQPCQPAFALAPIIHHPSTAAHQRRAPFISPQGHFLASAQGALLDDALHPRSTRSQSSQRIAGGAFMPGRCDFGLSSLILPHPKGTSSFHPKGTRGALRCLMNNAG